MTSIWHAPEIAVLWLVCWLVASLLTAAFYSLYQRAGGNHDPASRATGLLVYALLGPVAALLAVVLMLLPDLAGALVVPHCHGSECTPHAPSLGSHTFVGATLLTLSAVFGSALLWLLARWLLQHRQQQRMLEMLADPAGDRRFRLVQSPAGLAWCSGLWRPQVFVCRGLLEFLPADELQAVLAHEQAHALRHDNLQRMIMQACTLLWPAGLRSRIRREFALACEQACDRIAVHHTGNVASLIRAITRLGAVPAAASAARMPFSTEHPHERLAALQEPAGHDVTAAREWLFIAGLCLMTVVLLTVCAHPLLEWLTG